MSKLLVLGIDGADFDIIDPLLDQGRIPNLQRIAESGLRGPLRSTVPPSTCPGWQSFYTGMSPGNIGIFGFRNFHPESYDVHIPDSSDLAAPTYWDVMGGEGIRNGVVGGPFTYPPQEMNGFTVTGPWTPSASEVFTHPPELSDELREVCEGEYVFIPENYNEDEFREAFDRRTEVATHLLSNHDWDVFTLVYRPDPIQHVCWDKDNEVIFRLYEYLDECIGDVLEAAEASDGELNILVMSDHGFEGVRRRYFHVNQWLSNQGYLRTKSDALTTLMNAIPLEGLMNVASRLGVLEFIKRNFVSHEVKEAVSNPLHAIDWERSEAFFIWEQQTGQIYLNVEGRFPRGIIKQKRRLELATSIKQSLEAVKDHRGVAVVERCWLGTELYSGAYSDTAPDVVFTLTEEYKGQGTFGNLFTSLDRDRAEGGHHIDGILLASGPDFTTGEVDGVEIIDLAPSLLHLTGAPVVNGMDGEVRFDLYNSDREVSDREVRTTEGQISARKTVEWTDEERAEVDERLEDLGYL